MVHLSNHLGNVLVTISDRHIPVDVHIPLNGTDYYLADRLSATDYYAFGQPMPARQFTLAGSTAYRFGFNGMEKANEFMVGASEFDARMYNSLNCRFLSLDPIKSNYPWNSPYAFAENDVISSIELEGMEKIRLSDKTLIHNDKSFAAVRADKGEANIPFTYGIIDGNGAMTLLNDKSQLPPKYIEALDAPSPVEGSNLTIEQEVLSNSKITGIQYQLDKPKPPPPPPSPSLPTPAVETAPKIKPIKQSEPLQKAKENKPKPKPTPKPIIIGGKKVSPGNPVNIEGSMFPHNLETADYAKNSPYSFQRTGVNDAINTLSTALRNGNIAQITITPILVEPKQVATNGNNRTFGQNLQSQYQRFGQDVQRKSGTQVTIGTPKKGNASGYQIRTNPR